MKAPGYQILERVASMDLPDLLLYRHQLSFLLFKLTGRYCLKIRQGQGQMIASGHRVSSSILQGRPLRQTLHQAASAGPYCVQEFFRRDRKQARFLDSIYNGFQHMRILKVWKRNARARHFINDQPFPDAANLVDFRAIGAKLALKQLPSQAEPFAGELKHLQNPYSSTEIVRFRFQARLLSLPTRTANRENDNGRCGYSLCPTGPVDAPQAGQNTGPIGAQMHMASPEDASGKDALSRQLAPSQEVAA